MLEPQLSRFLSGAFRHFSDPLFVKNGELAYVYVNEAFARFHGRASADLLGRTDRELFPAALAEARAERDRALFALPKTADAGVHESAEEHGTGAVARSLLVRRFLIADESGESFLVGQAREVTEERRRRDFLRATESAGSIGAFDHTQPSGVTFWSDGLFEILGLDPRTSAASGEAFLVAIHPDDRDGVIGTFARASAEKSPFLETEYRILRPNDGGLRWVRSAGRFEHTSDGFRFFGTTQDITELRTSEVRRRESERRFEDVLEMIEEVVWSLAWGTWETIFMTSSVERFYGVPLSTIHDPRDWVRAFAAGEIQRMLEMFQNAADRGGAFSGEFRFVHPQRGDRIAFIRGKVVRDAAGKPSRVEGLTMDITELRLAENELQDQRQKLLALAKLNTLGELASGIGHEINTPLSGILSKIARVAHALADAPNADAGTETSRRLLAEAMALVERIAQIVDGLKRLSQGRTDETFEEFDPRLALDQALSLSRARFSNHGIRIAVDDPLPADTRVYGKPSTLFQALVNLLNNAFDALESRAQGGHVVIRLSVDDDRVFVRVCDNGIGIAEDFRPRLFEAFQTTKAEGRGTGLGLSISRRLLRAESGELALVEAPDGSVTCFEITLKRKPRPGKLPERG